MVPPVIINNTDAFFIKITVSESDVEITFFVRQNYKKMSNYRQTVYLLATLILLSLLGLIGCSVRYRFRFIGEDKERNRTESSNFFAESCIKKCTFA